MVMGLTSPRPRTLALIVDCAQDEREAYAEYLAQHGISTVEAEDGSHGIAKAASLLPDVIAIDLRPPHRDAIDMCVWLKQQDSTKHIPIIAVAEIYTASEIERALRAGCTAVLVKPCLPDVLLNEIRRVVARPASSV
jgi:two-component system, cell cycle response regulator DivK